MDINDINNLYDAPEPEAAGQDTEVGALLEAEPNEPAEVEEPQIDLRSHLSTLEQNFQAQQQQLFAQNQALQNELAEMRRASAKAAEPAPSEVDKLLSEHLSRHTAPILQKMEQWERQQQEAHAQQERRTQVERHAQQTARAAESVLFKGFDADTIAALRGEAIQFGMTASAAYELPPDQALARAKSFLDKYADAKYKAKAQTTGNAVAQSRAQAPTVTAPNSVASAQEKRPITDADRKAIAEAYGPGPDGFKAAFIDGGAKLRR